mgnify:CR=1 FL=1
MSDRINAVHVLHKLPVRYIQPLLPSDLLQLIQGLGGRGAIRASILHLACE